LTPCCCPRSSMPSGPPRGAPIGGRRNRHRWSGAASDAAEAIRRLSPQLSAPPDDRPLPDPQAFRVLGLAINGVADELALDARPSGGRSPNAFTSPRRACRPPIGDAVRERVLRGVLRRSAASPPSKTRYLIQRLRAALPEVRILVGRWHHRRWRTSTQVLRAGANHGATLVESGNTWAASWSPRSRPGDSVGKSRGDLHRQADRCRRRMLVMTERAPTSCFRASSR
jgi:hypothetical protein